MVDTPLTDSFLAALEPTRAALLADREALEPRLARLLAAGRTAWPGLPLDPQRFVSRLAAALSRPASAQDPDPLQPLEQLHGDDLYLACACADGDPTALRAFEAQLLPGVRAALGQLRLASPVVEELVQTLRSQLFVVREDGLPPMIENYSGLGPLRAWLRIAAVRIAGRWLGKERREVPLPEEALDAAVLPGEDPALLHLKEAYHAEFREAFTAALQTLPTRERAVLKQHYLDGLSLDELGIVFRVHRATAARWLAQARATLLARTREALTGKLALAPDEFESVMRLIGSRLGFTFRELLERS
jgi:RNA polymerase sigma-70 factor, ECF subfamily